MMSPRSFLVTRQNPRYTAAAVTLPSQPPASPEVKRKDDRQVRDIASSSSSNFTTAAMAAKRKASESSSSPTPSPPKTTTNLIRPTTPTSPVQIPIATKSRGNAHLQKPHRYHGDRRHQPVSRPNDVHAPEAIPPAVAALLAITSIPPPRGSRNLRMHRQRRALEEKRMTVESIIERSQESEKELSLSMCRSPMDLLLSAPEELEVDNDSIGDSTLGSAISTRAVSLESMPSLDDNFTIETFSSIGTPLTSPRRGRLQPTRRSLEPVSSPPGELEDHPLSEPLIEVEQLDFRVFESPPEEDRKSEMRLPLRPLKSAFKSNLTASLKALRQAARSFSTLNFPSIPPEDFLTRSILTIDPPVPYTDERRPPPSEEEPTAALRRYLNPTTNSRIEQPLPVSPTAAGRNFTASIQMQTYKVHRARSAPAPASRIPRPSLSSSVPKSGSVSRSYPEQKSSPLEYPLPGPRQREMRENSDFIRIAVMEMAMRKRGKLDDQRPGRARWALPPRKVSSKPYEIGADGVPTRWVAITY